MYELNKVTQMTNAIELKFDDQMLEDTAQITVMLTAPRQSNMIAMIKKEMDRIWVRYTDQTGHMIEGKQFSPVKTDAIKQYLEQLSTLTFNSLGGWHRGYSKDTVGEFSDSVMMFINRISSQLMNHNELFTALTVNVFGYDKVLVDIALTTVKKEKSDLLLRYVAQKFDILPGEKEPEHYWGGQYKETLFDDILANGGAVFTDAMIHLTNNRLAPVSCVLKAVNSLE